MCSWYSTMRENILQRYKTFIWDKIPNNLLPEATKSKFVRYLEQYLNCEISKETFTAEVLFHVNLD